MGLLSWLFGKKKQKNTIVDAVQEKQTSPSKEGYWLFTYDVDSDYTKVIDTDGPYNTLQELCNNNALNASGAYKAYQAKRHYKKKYKIFKWQES